jgi:hypothetical protein
MRRVVSFLFLLTLIAPLGCASARSSRPATIPEPEISAGLVSPLHFGSLDTTSATIEVRITNRATVPIMVRRIEIDSPGMQQYTIDRGVRDFRETIAPGETKALTVFTRATAVVTTRPDEPLQLRTVVEFASGENTWREVTMLR